MLQALDISVLRMHGSSNYTNKVTWDPHVTQDDKFRCHLRIGSTEIFLQARQDSE